MAHWAVILPADRWATERLFHHDMLTVPDQAGHRPDVGDEVLVLAGDEPAVVAVARVADGAEPDVARMAYVRRSFDQPAPADGLALDGPLAPVDPAVFQRLAARLGTTGRRSWLVSLDLPIEAGTPAEAVRQFWSYVRELGPQELPTYVSATGDELTMQAFVLGAEANQDPEQDDAD